MEEIVLKTGERLHLAPGETLGGTDGAALTVRYDATEPVGNEIAVMTLIVGEHPLRVVAELGGIAADCTLDWGDGSTPVEIEASEWEQIIAHEYAKPGTYPIMLTAGGVTKTVSITVRDTVGTSKTERVTLYDAGVFG